MAFPVQASPAPVTPSSPHTSTPTVRKLDRRNSAPTVYNSPSSPNVGPEESPLSKRPEGQPSPRGGRAILFENGDGAEGQPHLQVDDVAKKVLAPQALAPTPQNTETQPDALLVHGITFALMTSLGIRIGKCWSNLGPQAKLNNKFNGRPDYEFYLVAAVGVAAGLMLNKAKETNPQSIAADIVGFLPSALDYFTRRQVR